MIGFETLWARIRDRYSNEIGLETISTGCEFKAMYDSSYDVVVVTPLSTKMPRHITKRDFRNIWKKLVKIEGDPYRPGYYQRETRNASYILALIKDILEEENKEKSLNLSQEAIEVLDLKGVKGIFRGIVKYTWEELEEATEKFVKEGRR